MVSFGLTSSVHEAMLRSRRLSVRAKTLPVSVSQHRSTGHRRIGELAGSRRTHSLRCPVAVTACVATTDRFRVLGTTETTLAGRKHCAHLPLILLCIACPPTQTLAVQYDDLAATYLNQLAGNEPPQYLVRRGTGSSSEVGEHFLSDRDHNALITVFIQPAQIG